MKSLTVSEHIESVFSYQSEGKSSLIYSELMKFKLKGYRKESVEKRFLSHTQIFGDYIETEGFPKEWVYDEKIQVLQYMDQLNLVAYLATSKRESQAMKEVYIFYLMKGRETLACLGVKGDHVIDFLMQVDKKAKEYSEEIRGYQNQLLTVKSNES
ncbi:MAG: hypothetical protein ABSB40_06705 [Nitrososphaeria archaeon]|jgi:hypothetical protein